MLTNNFLLRVLYIFFSCQLCSGLTLNVHAQEPGNPEFSDKIGFSANTGYTFAHTDFRHTVDQPSLLADIGVHYFSLQYLEIRLGFQLGAIKGGSSQFAESNKTGFRNNYWASCLSFRFFPFGLAENYDKDKVIKALASLYAGTGLGYLKSNTRANPVQQPEYGALVTYKGSDFFVPVELGLNIPVARQKKNLFLLNLNFRTNLCLSDEIDGYVPTVDANKFNDAFSTLTAGVIYKFGL